MELSTGISKACGKLEMRKYDWLKIHLDFEPIAPIGKFPVYTNKDQTTFLVLGPRWGVYNLLRFSEYGKFGLEVDYSAANGKGPKQYKLYQHVMKYTGKSIVSGYCHSIGSVKVWKKLARIKSINIFGWYNSQPVNIDPLLDDVDNIYIDDCLRDKLEWEDFDSNYEMHKYIENMRLVAHLI